MVASFVLLEVHKYGTNLDLDLDALKQKDRFGIIRVVVGVVGV